MKAILIFLSALFLAATASAYELKIIIPPGAGLTRLAQLCDWLKVDANNPAMTNDECAMRLLLRGAFVLNHEKKLQQLQREGRDALRAADDLFKADLPMPADRGTPTPTTTPTATPTPTPTP